MVIKMEVDRIMQRLGIFCFYDRDGIVDGYIDYFLANLSKNLDDLFIVINGHANEEGIKVFEKYTNRIIIRKNQGFDAGAYRDILVNILGKDGISKWDEIVLCNDTFYGPFIPFKNIFERMETKNVDFWGLDYYEAKFLSTIRSYFLVFRKQILWNGNLFDYMKEYIDSECKEIKDVYAYFEVGLFSYLVKSGYKYDTFTYTNNYDIYLNGDRCIEECQLPILKKKCFSEKFYARETMLRILKIIQEKFNYDIKYILENANRVYGVHIYPEIIYNREFSGDKSIERKKPNLTIIDERIILDFLQKYNDIYIYGTGIIARKIWFLFHQYIKNFRGYIVSDGQSLGERNLYGYPIVHYSEVKCSSAIVIGLDDENSKEIVPILKRDDKVLVMWEELKM